MNILNLPHWKVIQVEQTSDDYRITAEYQERPSHCPKCSCWTDIKGHGQRPQIYMDLTMHEKRVGIVVQRQRYKCYRCNAVWIQELPDMHEQHRMTKRLVAYIERESIRKTFAELAERFGIDESTIREIFTAYAARLDKERVVLAPEWLGIDEVHLHNAARCVLTDLKEMRIIDVLKTYTQRAVTGYLMRLPDRYRIELAAIDMHRPYKNAVEAALNCVLVVDKFHVVRMANEAMEAVRKAMHQDLTDKERKVLKHDRYIMLHRKRDLDPKMLLLLDYWIRNFPTLGQAYLLKETFFDIWDGSDRKQAEEGYDEWVAGIPDGIRWAYGELTTALTNWRGEVFNYFDYPATNAYTEAANGLIKIANRAGRGYSFDVIRAKMIHYQLHKRTREKYQRDEEGFEPVVCESRMGGTYHPARQWEIDVYTIAEEIEAGKDPLRST